MHDIKLYNFITVAITNGSNKSSGSSNRGGGTIKNDHQQDMTGTGKF